MTLGKKLSNHRKILGLTQQQLGEHLNISPQAVSKWENDLAEPDIATLRALAELYNVSIDELTNPNIPFGPERTSDMSGNTANNNNNGNNNEETPKDETIGFCKYCGIAVTEKTVGQKEPVVACKKCIEKKEREKQEMQQREEVKKRSEFHSRQNVLISLRRKSLIVAIFPALFSVISYIYVMSQDFRPSLIPMGIISTYLFYAFTFCMFFDCVPKNVTLWMLSRSIRWPGIIFSFDIDGFIRFILIKILFALLSFIFGLVLAFLALFVGLVLSGFVFPFLLFKLNRDISDGNIEGYDIV